MAYTKAREALRIAREKYDLSYQEIAELCQVSLGSVKRWMLNGRADEKAIAPLVAKIGQVYLTASQVADHVIDIYNTGARLNSKGRQVHRFRLTDEQLAQIAGRHYVKNSFQEELFDELREQGLLMVKGTGYYLVVSWKWLFESCADIDDESIPDYYEQLANEIDDECEDEMAKTKNDVEKVRKGMHFDEVRSIVGDEMRLFQPPGTKPEWPRNKPKPGCWVLTGKEYSDDCSTTFIEFDENHNVSFIGCAGHR